MSLTFSRRSFLKYTAVAAVAVAGSSLLTGCKDNPYQPEGAFGKDLKVMGTFNMSSPVYDAANKKFPAMSMSSAPARTRCMSPLKALWSK